MFQSFRKRKEDFPRDTNTFLVFEAHRVDGDGWTEVRCLGSNSDPTYVIGWAGPSPGPQHACLEKVEGGSSSAVLKPVRDATGVWGAAPSALPVALVYSHRAAVSGLGESTVAKQAS